MRFWVRAVSLLFAIVVGSHSLAVAAQAADPELLASGSERALLLATTTSVRDTGLLDDLLPRFQASSGVPVKTIAVGTGAALRMGAEGNVDVLLTHAPLAEEALVASGALLARHPFMENHFVIAGPPGDPAAIAVAASPVDAYRRLAAAAAPYVSRGDESGTHLREKELLDAAGLPESAAWKGFLQTGSGMGLSLQVAGEKRAYILSDIGTFLAYRKRTELVSLLPPSPELRNVYSVIRVNPAMFPNVESEAAERFEAFLLDPSTQELIGIFGIERFGQPLFRPLLAVPQPD